MKSAKCYLEQKIMTERLQVLGLMIVYSVFANRLAKKPSFQQHKPVLLLLLRGSLLLSKHESTCKQAKFFKTKTFYIAINNVLPN